MPGLREVFCLWSCKVGQQSRDAGLPGFGMRLYYTGCAWSLTYILMSRGPTLECFCHFPLGNAKTLGIR